MSYASRSRRRRGTSTDIWPGFVDVLSTLLLVMIFLLVVYMLAQYFLQRSVSEKSEALSELDHQVAELADLLSLERQSNSDLRSNISQLSAELQNSLAERDALTLSLTRAEDETDTLRLRLRDMTSEAQTALSDATDANRKVSEALLRAEAGEEKIRVMLSDVEQLRRDIEALRTVRADLEDDVIELAAALQSREEEASQLSEELKSSEDSASQLAASLRSSEDEASRLGDKLSRSEDQTNRLGDRLRRSEDQASRLAALLRDSKDEASRLADALDKSEREKANLDRAFSAARDRSSELLAKLSDETERTALAQKELDDRDIRLREVQDLYLVSENQLVETRDLSKRQRDEIGLLNRQILAIRAQLSRIEAVLDASEAKTEAQKVVIADLGQRLNLALAAKVEELAEYRSEFFGRLRRVLAGRQGFTIIGDRFVFQSEVLFASGSSELGFSGKVGLNTFATELKDVMTRIPQDLPWILQVDGHTDRIPINTPRFPSNWDLSSARAIEVVNYLVTQGIPPARLSATGYGEFQPIDERDDEIALRRNRRIELKLTQR
ncbi:MAG TPA: peptidoglycan -binding protein [Alphaproteobacteria bacterium]|jgi:chemotaxis protein MotB|nr:peptidoglycan -binding protein [Alphaproteobacteria bacterium]HJN60483.1 peptidoglycan -binding protein [Alphaproteobacteria bacterium]